MRSKLPPSLLCILLGTTGAYAADIPDYPFVFVVGNADTDTPPNIAFCSTTVRARETDSDKAAALVDERLKSVLATLRVNHIAAGDIESSSVVKQVLTNDRDDFAPATIKGYDIWRTVKFTVRQLDAIAPVHGVLVRSPNISDTECRFDRTDRTAVEGDLQTKALHSAREQADHLVTPLGRHVVAAVAISKTPFQSIAGAFGFDNHADFERMDRMFKRSVGPEGPSGDDLLVPTTIHLSASVNVLFKME